MESQANQKNQKVKSDLFVGLLKNLKSGIDNLVDACEMPVRVGATVGHVTSVVYRSGRNSYSFLRDFVPNFINDTVNPIMAGLTHESIPGKTAKIYLKERIVHGLNHLVDVALSVEQNREKEAYEKALKDLQANVHSLYRYLGRYVELP